MLQRGRLGELEARDRCRLANGDVIDFTIAGCCEHRVGRIERGLPCSLEEVDRCQTLPKRPSEDKHLADRFRLTRRGRRPQHGQLVVIPLGGSRAQVVFDCIDEAQQVDRARQTRLRKRLSVSRGDRSDVCIGANQRRFGCDMLGNSAKSTWLGRQDVPHGGSENSRRERSLASIGKRGRRKERCELTGGCRNSHPLAADFACGSKRTRHRPRNM